MRTLSIVQGLIRGTGALQVLMGVAIWTGIGVKLTSVHMWIGIVFVLSLWALAILAARARAGAGFVAVVLLWGAITAAFGMAQPQILPGPQHWVIRVLHLLIGVAAMGLADGLGRRARRAAPRATPSLAVQSATR